MAADGKLVDFRNCLQTLKTECARVQPTVPSLQFIGIRPHISYYARASPVDVAAAQAEGYETT
jgi:hypothetical protein